MMAEGVFGKSPVAVEMDQFYVSFGGMRVEEI